MVVNERLFSTFCQKTANTALIELLLLRYAKGLTSRGHLFHEFASCQRCAIGSVSSLPSI